MSIPSRAPRALLIPLAALLLAAWGSVAADPQADPQALIAGVLANQRTSGLRARAKLEISPAGGRSQTVQVLIKSRRAGSTVSTLVVAMWPAELKGQAWMLERSAGGAPSGFHFTPPDKVEKLGRDDFSAALFGSQFSIEDLAESFWEWPVQRLTGEERVGREDCWVVESSRTAGAKPVVRSWLAKDKPVPMRVEKLTKGGQIWKRIDTRRVIKRSDGGWSLAELSVGTAAGSTTLTGGSAQRGLVLPAADFTPGAVKALTAGK